MKTVEAGESLFVFGEPFARALATFIACLEEECSVRIQGKGRPKMTVTIERPAAVGSAKMLKVLDRQADRILQEHRRAKKSNLTGIEFSADTPTQAIANRLRLALESRGMSQQQLAAKLGVTPAVISRVFKNPNRSRLTTLQRIADALGVEVRTLV